MARALGLAALAWAGMAGAGASHAAGPSNATVGVSARVLGHASLKVVSQPASVVVTAVDVLRGYVDAPAPTRIVIRSNSTAGYLLEIATEGDLVAATQLHGASGEVRLGAGGGRVARTAAQRDQMVELGIRFHLAKSAQPGVYAWPMQMSVVPL